MSTAQLLTIKDLANPESDSLFTEVEGLYGAFHQWLESGNGENPHARAPGIHASEISSCPRKVVYSILGTDKKGFVPADMKKIFKLGHLVHDMLQKDFGKMSNESQGKLTFHKEQAIDPFTNPVAGLWQIYSSCDGVFTWWRRDHRQRWAPYMRMGLEIKSANPTDFASLTKPKPDHIEQAHLYMACLDLPATWLLYLNKSNLNMTSSAGKFLVRFNHETWRGLEERFEKFHDAADRGVLPDREEGMHCGWCPYGYTCEPTYLAKKFKKPELIPLRTSK